MKCNYEKILKREDGKRVRITVYFQEYRYQFQYTVSVHHCEKGKRTWKGCLNTGSHTHRSLSLEDRVVAVEKSYLDYVTEQEILDAKMSLWHLMRPNRREGCDSL
jgi:hypothetical protein